MLDCSWPITRLLIVIEAWWAYTSWSRLLCFTPPPFEGYEIADGWANIAAEEPDSHGVEWLRHIDKDGRGFESTAP